jgi:Protein of unknown function (DUF4236)
MGFRFRRSFKLAPGVRINLSKSGASTSIGVRGAHVTLGHGQVRETVGIPGSGISYSEQHRARSSGAGGIVLLVIILAAIAWLFL